MRKFKFISLLVIVIIFVSGCGQTDYHKNPRIFIDLPDLLEFGMTESEVQNKLGKPEKIVKGKKNVRKIYREANEFNFLDTVPDTYFKEFKYKGKIEKYDSTDFDTCYIYKFKGVDKLTIYFINDKFLQALIGSVDLKKSEYYLYDEFEEKYGKIE